ncbi:MAG: histone-like protein [Candidatus Micrarchaeia archaeon]
MLSKTYIKKFVWESFHVKISDQAAGALVDLLNKKASSIAKYAVKSAKKDKRTTILEKDIKKYSSID